MAIRRSEPLFYNGKHYLSRKEFCETHNVNYQMFTMSMRQGATVEGFMEEYYKKKNKIAPHIKDAAITVEVVETDTAPVTKFIGQVKKKYAEIVYSPSELIGKLSEIKSAKSVNLIDYENLADDDACLKDLISDENCVNVFFYNALKYSNQFYMINKESKSINYQVITSNVEKQLVDHLIIFYLGTLNTVSNKVQYNIVSKDSGYYMFIHELDMPNINIIGFEKFFLDKEKRFELSLAKYINELRIDTCKSLNLYELKNIFRGFKHNNFNDILRSLIEFGFVKKIEESTNHSEYYLINKNKAAIVISRSK